MAVTILGCATILASNVTAAVHYQASAEAYRTALKHSAANDTKKYEEYYALAVKEDVVVINALPVQQFSEVTMLLFIVAAYLLAGIVCARRIRDALRIVERMYHKSNHSQHSDASEAMEEGRKLKLKIFVSTLFAFLAFILRSTASAMIAFAFALRDYGKTCPGETSYCDTSCYNAYTHITIWLGSTPEFRPSIVLISSPLAQLILLWGMTTNRIWQRLKPNRRDDVLEL